MSKVIRIFFVSCLFFYSCNMESCSEFDSEEHLDFTINGNPYPKSDDPESENNYFSSDDQEAEIEFKSSQPGYWDTDGDGKGEHEEKMEVIKMKFSLGEHFVSYWIKDGGPKTTKKVVIDSPTVMDDEGSSDVSVEPDDFQKEIDKIKKQTGTSSSPKIDPALAQAQADRKKQEIAEARARREAKKAAKVQAEADAKARREAEAAAKKQAEADAKAIAAAKEREENEKRRREREEDDRRQKEKEDAKKELERLRKSLKIKNTGLIVSDISCINNSNVTQSSGKTILSIMDNMRINGTSVYSSKAGKIKITLTGPNGEIGECSKYVNTGLTNLLFPEWSNFVLKSGEEWAIKFKSNDDDLKLHFGDGCIIATSKDLKAKNNYFLFNLSYFTAQ